MSTLQSSAPMPAPMRLWHRFHIWRAMRKYRRIVDLNIEAQILKSDADALMVKHARPPMPLFDRADGGR